MAKHKTHVEVADDVFSAPITGMEPMEGLEGLSKRQKKKFIAAQVKEMEAKEKEAKAQAKQAERQAKAARRAKDQKAQSQRAAMKAAKAPTKAAVEEEPEPEVRKPSRMDFFKAMVTGKPIDGTVSDAKAQKQRSKTQAEMIRELRKSSGSKRKATRAARDERNRPKSVQDAIGYVNMYENGICEVEPGLYSATISVGDITYQAAQQTDQEIVLENIYGLLNGLGAEVRCQWNVINEQLPQEEIGNREFYKVDAQTTETRKEDARVLNKILNDKLKEGVSNIRRERYITFSVDAENVVDATRKLAGAEANIRRQLGHVKCETHRLTGLERLRLIQAQLRPGVPFTFGYGDLNLYSKLTTKDFIAPMAMDFAPEGGQASYYTADGVYMQTLVVRSLGSPLSDNAIGAIADIQIPMNISWHLAMLDRDEAVAQVRSVNMWMDSDIISQQKRAAQQGYSMEVLSADVRDNRADADRLLTKLTAENENLFWFTGLISTWADTREELDDRISKIISTASSMSIQVELLEYRQVEGMNSVLPFACNNVDVRRQLMTCEAQILVPFATQELEQEGGNWYYQNKASNNLVFGDRKTLASPIGFIAGKTGSGKGFFIKNEIEGTLLNSPGDQIIIIDRAGEYIPLTEHHNGAVANFGVGHESYMNPLGMEGLSGHGYSEQVIFKVDAMLAQAAASGEQASHPISDEERSIIQRCVEQVYAQCPDDKEPTLGDFYQVLLSQPEPIAESIALRYERYVKGSNDFFNHTSNIDFDNEVVDLNFKDIPESMLVFGLINACEAIRYQMYSNFAKGRRTWLYIEEMESLFRYPTVFDYFRRFANEGRKFGLMLTGITQSVESMMLNEQAKALVKGADFVMLFAQSATDRAVWQALRGLSDQEMGFISEGVARGDGLLCFGGARIPIKGQFPTGNPMYELYTTDANEQLEKNARAALEANRAAEGSGIAPDPRPDAFDGLGIDI